MAFTRKFLIDNGVPEDKVDVIMTERNRTLADYVPKSDVQTQIDAAVETVRAGFAPQQINVKETDEYKTLQAELDMTTAVHSADFESVKPKFRKTVYGMLDSAKPVAEQLPAIREQFEEYFTPVDTNNQPQPGTPPKPQFGEPPAGGGMPKGTEGKSLSELWGYPKKG